MAKKLIVKITDALKTFTSKEPKLETEGAAGYDLIAAEDMLIRPHVTMLVKTTFKWAIPKGYVGMVCSRSGMALKHSVFVLNAPGIVDSDYRGDVGVIIHNGGGFDYTIRKGDRIAQMVLVKHAGEVGFEKVSSEEFAKLETKRGEDGFGSTGK